MALRNPNSAACELLYTPLQSQDPDEHHIRLLSIKSAPGEPVIRCQLRTAPLLDAADARYFALSYAWGDSQDTEAILINGLDFQATKNLSAALHEISRSHGYAADALWVDAICINQDDIPERNNQVRIMDQIYSRAWEVLCWLGPEDDYSSTSIRLINALSQDLSGSPEMWAPVGTSLQLKRLENETYTDLVRKMDGNLGLLDFSPFTDRPYWSRVWTLQEVVLAKWCKLICGGRSCYLQQIGVLDDWVHHPPVEVMILAGERPANLTPEVWGLLTYLHKNAQHCIPVVEVLAMRKIVSKSKRGRPSISRLLGLTVNRRATDIRDKLYGLSGMSDIGVEIDYTLDPTELFTRFAEYFVQHLTEARNLDVDLLALLKYAGLSALSLDSNLPSWVPDWMSAGNGTVQGPTKAHGGSPPESRFVRANKTLLSVHGICLDVVQGVLQGKPTDTSKQELQDIARTAKFLFQNDARKILEGVISGPPREFLYKTGIPLLEAVIRLFVGDIDIRTKTPFDPKRPEPLPPLIHGLLSDDSVRGTKLEQMWTTDDTELKVEAWDSLVEVLDRDRSRKVPVESIIAAACRVFDDELHANFMEEKQFTSWIRPFRTATGYIGCASSAVTKGDIVCVLGSCSKPVVLRRVTGGDKYQFVSLANVVGVLYGEVWNTKQEIVEFVLI